jgi:hypothetical protein
VVSMEHGGGFFFLFFSFFSFLNFLILFFLTDGTYGVATDNNNQVRAQTAQNPVAETNL